MATNSSYIKTQSLVTDAFAFSWLKQPGLIERIDWNSEAARKIGAVNRTGESVSSTSPEPDRCQEGKCAETRSK